MAKLKMLCFPGRNTNAEIFRMQLAPYMRLLERDGSVELRLTQGTIEGHDEKGWETFGPPPNLRFFQENLVPSSRRRPSNADSVDSIVRSYDTDRGGEFPAQASVRKAFWDVQAIIGEEGPFHGVIGFSEGASLAAAILAQDQLWQNDGQPSHQLRCGIFFNGYPPFTSDGKKLMLSDEFGQLIQVPTLHIISGCDSFHIAGLALRQLCSYEQAIIYEHDEGHRVPWKPQVTKPLREKIRQFVQSINVAD